MQELWSLVEYNFEICWNCGHSCNGVKIAQFEHADNYQPEAIKTVNQFSLKSLAIAMTAFCLTFAGFSAESPLLFVVCLAPLSLLLICAISPY